MLLRLLLPLPLLLLLVYFVDANGYSPRCVSNNLW